MLRPVAQIDRIRHPSRRIAYERERETDRQTERAHDSLASTSGSSHVSTRGRRIDVDRHACMGPRASPGFPGPRLGPSGFDIAGPIGSLLKCPCWALLGARRSPNSRAGPSWLLTCLRAMRPDRIMRLFNRRPNSSSTVRCHSLLYIVDLRGLRQPRLHPHAFRSCVACCCLSLGGVIMPSCLGSLALSSATASRHPSLLCQHHRALDMSLSPDCRMREAMCLSVVVGEIKP